MNGLEALESLFELPFVDDPRTRHVLESAAKDMYSHLLDKLEKELERSEPFSEFQQTRVHVHSTLQKCADNYREADENYYWDGTDEAEEELDNTSIQLNEVATWASEHMATKQKELELYFEWIADQMTSSSSEVSTTTTPTGILTNTDHLSKGKLAELAISLMLSGFRTHLSTQHQLTQHRIIGDIIVFKENGLRFWNEVKCIDQLRKHDIEQLQNLLRSSEERICYHFVRLLRHQQNGFNAWRNSIISQLTSLIGKPTKLFVAFFYRVPLISLKSNVIWGKNIHLQAASSFDLLSTSQAISLGTEFEWMNSSLLASIRKMRIVQSSSLLISVASITSCSAFDLYNWLKLTPSPPTWIKNNWEQPTSTEAILNTADLLTQYLKRPLVIEVDGRISYLLWHSMFVVESEGEAYWTGSPGGIFDGLCVSMLVGSPAPRWYQFNGNTEKMPSAIKLRMWKGVVCI